MKPLRRALRLSRLSLHIVNGIVLTAVLAGVLRRSCDEPFYQQLIRWWLGKLPRLMGVTVTVKGEPASETVLMVANHISWLDIPVLGSVAKVRFLSKQEVRHWPVVGWLADKAGTLFITRGQAGAAAQAAATISQALQAGRAVLLFPEGTTSTGNAVRTFHARLLAPAMDAQLPVQPVAVRYPGAEGLTNPLVPYVDQQSLWENLRAILGEREVLAEIHFLPLVQTAGQERKAVAAACEQHIRQALWP
ncbi:MAG: lysophospholipid acyltransferase family protein [Thiothrix sp.]|uniref:lysophospholipid acyltransferase family protein n=1 Tax=Thiothrix sp. TaxID=1032 RepID=UPI00261CAAC4|nr:lysophospholipid acyltransferase family protein [Thiothrix sp.]MDD5394450.1 lysophospholipid acyltransferase family protein [Thiothrix sp.]